jgi:Na+/H+ antiporter NhaD/arsenite permease-like protein
MTGLGILMVYGYFLWLDETKKVGLDIGPPEVSMGLPVHDDELRKHYKEKNLPFDIFISMRRAEWDTLMFFYGVVLCVGGLNTIGYLATLSQWMYVDLGPTGANVLVGILSAIVDNIPVMFAVLTMHPDMSHGQWLLVTLTAGVGGSLLSVGSAAGVALMGQARGVYTFFAHLKWIWAIGLGYVASIWAHLLINADLM